MKEIIGINLVLNMKMTEVILLKKNNKIIEYDMTNNKLYKKGNEFILTK